MAKVKEDRSAKFADALSRIADGESVRKACNCAGIAFSTFVQNVDPDQYARARDAQADAHFDEMTDLETQCQTGLLDPQVFKAVLDSRKWRLARMRPKVYGDTSKFDLTSSDGSMSPRPNPVEVMAEMLRRRKEEQE